VRRVKDNYTETFIFKRQATEVCDYVWFNSEALTVRKRFGKSPVVDK
jgi:hypothetical protein